MSVLWVLGLTARLDRVKCQQALHHLSLSCTLSLKGTIAIEPLFHLSADESSLTIGLNREWPRRDKASEAGEAERRATPDWAVRTKPLAFAADAAPMEFGSGFQKLAGDVGGRC